MDFDFLDSRFVNAAKDAVSGFRHAIEDSKPTEDELGSLVDRATSYEHCSRLSEDFTIGAVDGSGEYPILQQDDIFLHFAIASATLFETCSDRQHKLSVRTVPGDTKKSFSILRDVSEFVQRSYQAYLKDIVGLSLEDIVVQSDYCEVFSQYGRKALRKRDVTWDNIAFSKASEIATHAYQLRSLIELAMAIKLLEHSPKYVMIDTSLVYFLLGETIYLPEILKRYLITRAASVGTCVVALCKSHNIPNGDLIGRRVKEQSGLKDHWFLRLPSESLGEEQLSFLREKEVPPKLGISYLFKFHETSFPMRIDVDAVWWKSNINGDVEKEKRFFSELDYTCHDVRSYGYPYPMHAAHRASSLTRKEKKAARDILLQFAQQEGILRGASFSPDPEMVHMGGI
jgi:hypothetical protein